MTDDFQFGGIVPRPGSTFLEIEDCAMVVCRDPDTGELVWSIQMGCDELWKKSTKMER